MLGQAFGSAVDASSANLGTWNPADKSAGITLSGSNLVATVNTGAQSAVRGTQSRTSGKYYYEVTITDDGSGSYRVGVGISSAVLSNLVGDISNSVGIKSNNGDVHEAGASIGTGAAYVVTDRLGIAVDLTAKKFWFRVNGGNWNNSAPASPATGVGGFTFVFNPAGGTGTYAMFGSDTTSDAITANFGATAFTDALPSGFSAWG